MKMIKSGSFFSSRTAIGPLESGYPGNSAIPTKVSLLLGLVLAVLLMGATSVHAANRYVRQGATGANNGSDWSNAYTSLPATLIRGDTYYIADGSYGSTTFDDPASGSIYIYVKKATVGDHGTSSGWSDAYGDGQAIFGRIVFTTDNWVFDGVTRNDNDWSEQTAYGFVVAGGAGGNSAKLFDVSYTTNVTIQYTYSYFNSVKMGGDTTANQDQGLYSINNTYELTYNYNLMRNISYKAGVLLNSSSGITVKYNRFENMYKKEFWSSRWTDDVVIAYNYIMNSAGTGAIVCDDSHNWEIYGNVFWSPSSSYTFTDVTLGTWTGDHPSRTETLNNWKVYNNTFYQMRANSPGADKIQIQHGSGNVVANNLFIGQTISIDGSLTSLTNSQNASTGVVTDAGNGNFTLTSATTAGTTYGSPYNLDVFGNIRGNDGVWDRGAYEYGGVAPPPPPPPPPPLGLTPDAPTTLQVQ